MMEEGKELEDFLKKRGLKQDLIEKIQEQKIDCQTLCAMPESQLQMYIPKLGDVYATKRFYQELLNKQQKYSRKTTLLEKLRRKLGSKYNRHDVHDSEDESSDQRRAKLLGNANASKNERKIELGWCDFNLCSEKYQQVRNKNGGGTREAKVSKYWTAKDILEYGKILFFPGGVSKKGCESEFEFQLKDFQQSPVDSSATVEDLYKITQMRILRFYVYSRKKQPIVTVDASDKDLLEENLPGLTTCVEKSSFGLDLLSASAPVSPEGYVPTTYRAFSEAPTALNASTPASTTQSCDSNLQSSLLTVQVDNEIMFSLSAESCKLLSSEESPSVLCNFLPNTAASESGTLCVDDVDDIAVFESVSSESGHNLSPEFPTPQANTLQSAQEEGSLDSTLRIHQGNSFTELIKLYQKEDMCLSSCAVKRVLPNGEDERGEGVGLLRDIFTEFWESFYSKCCEGADIKVPILRHDMGEDEWKSVGRIICDGWSTLKYFPVQLAQPVLEDAIFGMITVSLTTTFLGFIPVSERTIIQTALDNFELVDMNDLLEVLESHECKRLPTPANIQSINEEIAHKEILQEPKFVIESWRKVFGTNLEMDQKVLCDIFQEKQPTVKKILNALNFPDVMDCNQQTTSNYLKRFVKGLDKKGMENFLRFCTGSNLMSEKITVEFTRLYGFERRPVAHTCGSILRMPTTYETFSDMREEFENILSSNVWEMSYV